ncbi:unnamed protein product [Trifolium pratense]|uniref:Uncharacterized protein n=1 Tax=Trifolium pratense TaxID=57577 RepID=A0ACB0K6Y8_TRIPR|nr:unnamed protein product [Trifolium pratense]
MLVFDSTKLWQGKRVKELPTAQPYIWIYEENLTKLRVAKLTFDSFI